MKKLILLLPFLFVGCTSANLEEVKAKAPEVWKQAGFEIVGYEGFQRGVLKPWPSYGGACAWYIVRKVPDNGVTYHGFIQRWGDEFHIYNLTAIDAIKPTGAQ